MTRPTVRDRLSSIFEEYLSRYNTAKHHIISQMVPDGVDLLCCVIQAFPYNLHKVPSIIDGFDSALVLPEGDLTPWANMYWAMSNAFSRPPPGAFTSTCNALLAHRYHDHGFRHMAKRA